MDQIGLIHKPKRKPNGITKADREARKSDDLLKRDFHAEKPLEKAVTDISELKAKDGKVYVSAIFDCFDLMPLGLSIEDNMKASLCCHTSGLLDEFKRPRFLSVALHKFSFKSFSNFLKPIQKSNCSF